MSISLQSEEHGNRKSDIAKREIQRLISQETIAAQYSSAFCERLIELYQSLQPFRTRSTDGHRPKASFTSELGQASSGKLLDQFINTDVPTPRKFAQASVRVIRNTQSQGCHEIASKSPVFFVTIASVPAATVSSIT
jgi:hypothetical protein